MSSEIININRYSFINKTLMNGYEKIILQKLCPEVFEKLFLVCNRYDAMIWVKDSISEVKEVSLTQVRKSLLERIVTILDFENDEKLYSQFILTTTAYFGRKQAEELKNYSTDMCLKYGLK